MAQELSDAAGGVMPPTAAVVTVVRSAVDAPDDDSPELQAERALVAQWAEKLKRAQKCDKEVRKEWAKWRKYAAGKPADPNDGEWLVSTNLIEATIEGLLPNLYARDPDVSVTAADAVDPASYPQVRKFAKSVQTVVSRLIWDAKLKSRMQRMIRSAMVVSVGWLKVAMQLDTVRDPIIERRIADLQDQMQRIGVLADTLTDDAASVEQQDAAKAELQAQIVALQEKVEVLKATGLVVDTVSADDVVVDDELRELADYAYAGWIAQRIWYTPEGAKAEFGLDDDAIRSASSYPRRATGSDEDGDRGRVMQQGKAAQSFLAAWEIWDRRANTVFTLIDGMKTWARAPYPPSPSGRRFYPFFLLAFHWQPDERYPQGDVEMWHKLQDEYSRTRSQYAVQRRRTKPARVFNKRALSVEDAKKLFDPETNEGVGVDPLEGGDVRALVGIIPTPPIDGALYDTSAIRFDLEQLSGLGDAQRSAMVKAKTATEASIIANSSASRLSVRQDAIEDVLEEICLYTAELALQSMTPEDATKYAGAGVVWPKLPPEQIHTLLDISIRSGSTGKPNQVAEQQAWTQVGPQLWQAVSTVYMAMKSGDTGLVEAQKTLLQMTLDKFGLKRDVNEIVPQQVPQTPPPGTQPPPPDAKQDDVLVRSAIETIDEARAKHGLPSLPGNLGAVPLVYTKNGAVPLSLAIANGAGVPQEVQPPAPAVPPPQALMQHVIPAPLPQNVVPMTGAMPPNQ